MPIKIDKDTRQRIIHSRHCGDIEYDLTGDTAISNETVKLLGRWKDHTGEGIPDTGPTLGQQMMFAGQTNTFFGTDESLDGAKLGNLNEVGEDEDTNRRRRIRRTIKV